MEVIIIAASVLYDGVKTTCCAKTIQRSLSAVSSWDTTIWDSTNKKLWRALHKISDKKNEWRYLFAETFWSLNCDKLNLTVKWIFERKVQKLKFREKLLCRYFSRSVNRTNSYLRKAEVHLSDWLSHVQIHNLIRLRWGLRRWVDH